MLQMKKLRPREVKLAIAHGSYTAGLEIKLSCQTPELPFLILRLVSTDTKQKNTYSEAL